MNLFEAPPETDDPREKLVRATLTEIEARGLNQLTVRSLSTAAGVNIAAVNYYFGSKEALVQVALNTAVDHMLADTERLLADAEAEPSRALGELFIYYLEGAARYPRVGRAQLQAAFDQDDYSGPFPTRLRPVMERLRDLLQRSVPGLDKRAAGRRALAALSGVFFPALFAGLSESLMSIGSARDRNAYAKQLAAQALAPTA